MWSLGCIAAELFVGLPIAPGITQHNQLERLVKLLGLPPSDMLDRGRNTTAEYATENSAQPVVSKVYFKGDKLKEVIDLYPMKKGLTESQVQQELQERICLYDFLCCVLRWDPTKRWTPSQARKHPFITKQSLASFSHSSVESPSQSGIPLSSLSSISPSISSSPYASPNSAHRSISRPVQAPAHHSTGSGTVLPPPINVSPTNSNRGIPIPQGTQSNQLDKNAMRRNAARLSGGGSNNTNVSNSMPNQYQSITISQPLHLPPAHSTHSSAAANANSNAAGHGSSGSSHSSAHGGPHLPSLVPSHNASHSESSHTFSHRTPNSSFVSLSPSGVVPITDEDDSAIFVLDSPQVSPEHDHEVHSSAADLGAFSISASSSAQASPSIQLRSVSQAYTSTAIHHSNASPHASPGQIHTRLPAHVNGNYSHSPHNSSSRTLTSNSLHQTSNR